MEEKLTKEELQTVITYFNNCGFNARLSEIVQESFNGEHVRIVGELDLIMED